VLLNTNENLVCLLELRHIHCPTPKVLQSKNDKNKTKTQQKHDRYQNKTQQSQNMTLQKHLLRLSCCYVFGRVSVLFLLCCVSKKLLNLEMICTVSLKIVVDS